MSRNVRKTGKKERREGERGERKERWEEVRKSEGWGRKKVTKKEGDQEGCPGEWHDMVAR